jgi:hypothetical protein
MPARILVGAMVLVLTLAVLIGLVRPSLARRWHRVLAGKDVPRSSAHYRYVGLEVVKVVGSFATGAMLLTT